MDWLTIVLIIIIGLLTWLAYRHGFVRELVSLCAVILAIPVAGIFFDDMFPKVHPLVSNVALANLISFIAIMAGVIIAGQIAAYLLKSMVNALNLGVVDALAGAAFGFLKAVVICQVVLIALVAFPRPDIRDDIDKSPLATALIDAAPVVLAILPGTFDDAVDIFTNTTGLIDDKVGDKPQP